MNLSLMKRAAATNQLEKYSKARLLFLVVMALFFSFLGYGLLDVFVNQRQELMANTTSYMLWAVLMGMVLALFVYVFFQKDLTFKWQWMYGKDVEIYAARILDKIPPMTRVDLYKHYPDGGVGKSKVVLRWVSVQKDDDGAWLIIQFTDELLTQKVLLGDDFIRRIGYVDSTIAIQSGGVVVILTPDK